MKGNKCTRSRHKDIREHGLKKKAESTREGKEAKSRPSRGINPKELEERYKQGDNDTTAWGQKTEMREKRWWRSEERRR